ncbi:MAG: hypothetical protein ACT4R6_04815 [Gemmatimonadaceae bacterium]
MNIRMTIAAVALPVVLTGCAGARQPYAFAPPALGVGQTHVTVTNNHPLDVAVYVVRSGMRARIGTVFGFATASLRIPRSVVPEAGTFQLQVNPIGSERGHLTDPISVAPGQWVDLRVLNPINLSSFAVWRR